MAYATLRQCHLCGNNFLPSSATAKFCSNTCRTNARKNRIDKVCERCGKAFDVVPVNGSAKYCSRACYRPPFITSCVTCGQAMKVKPGSGQRFCSKKCHMSSDDRKEQYKSAWERFNERVDKTPGHGPKGDCWLWTGEIEKDGYGRFRPNGKRMRVHRYAYSHFKGPIPKDLWVLHECDNRACCNPDHLWLGTCADNTKDMIAKGRNRHAVGEKTGTAKLTESDVRSILASSMPQNLLADKYGVSRANICMIKRGKIWAHLSRSEDQIMTADDPNPSGKG